MNWNKEKKVNVTVKKLDPGKNEVYKKEYKNIHLDGGRTVRPLETFRTEGIEEGYYFVIYEII